MGNEAETSIFSSSGGGASSGVPSPAGGGRLAERSILLLSSKLIDFDDSMIPTDWISQCPVLLIVYTWYLVLYYG